MNKTTLPEYPDSILEATLEEIVVKEIGKSPKNLIERLEKYIIKSERAYYQLGEEQALSSSQKDKEKAVEEEINRLYLVAEARGFLIGIASKLDNKRKKAALNIAERLGESNTRKLQSLNSKGKR